jgi:glycosyltransferase involved in cell wall biosynthesis
MELGVNFFGSIYTEDGIGEATRLTLEAFKNAGIKVAINPLSRPVAKENIKEEIKEFNTPYNINYFHFSARWVEYYLNIVGKEKLNNKYNIAHWLTEVKDYPNEWAKNHKYFNEIWTSSSFCQDSISMKIPCSTILMPYPIVGNKVNNSNTNSLFKIDNSKFNFLVMANMYSDIERKNVLQSLESFNKAFPTESNVSLIVKISNPDIDKDYMNKINYYIKADNRIILIDEFIDRDEINLLFQSVDAYVSLHRSEGFGLTLGEAMFHKVPVITTAYSGNIDFCNNFNSYLVDYDIVNVGENRLRYKSSDVWAQPRLSSAVEMFKKVYYDREDIKIKVKRAKEFIEENFSMDCISNKIRTRIEMINSNFKLEGTFGEYK